MWLRNVPGRAVLGTLGALLLTVGVIWAAEDRLSNPYTAREGSTPEQLVKYLERMLDKPHAIRAREAFQVAVVDAADRVLASGESEGPMFRAAVLSKLKILHEAGVFGNEERDQELVEVSKSYLDSKDEEVAEVAEFYLFERKVLDGGELPAEERVKLLEEAEKYLTDKALTDRHLRLASTIVGIINELPEDQNKVAMKKYGTFGKLFAKSKDRKLKMYGEQIAQGPGGGGGGGGGQAMPSQGPRAEFMGKPVELAGTSSEGGDFKYDKYKGKVVLVDFWATWCGPCIAMFPELMKLKEDYKEQGFEIIGVNLDQNVEKLKQFAEGREIPWEMIVDGLNGMKMSQLYQIRSIPHILLVDRNGNIVSERLRGPALRSKIEELLAEKPVAKPAADKDKAKPADKPSEDKDSKEEAKK